MIRKGIRGIRDMGKANSIILSFCVPSYNRRDATLMIVNSILQYEGEDIEVVVVDNCSTDDTISCLSQIDDKRLHYFINKQNYGAVGNFVESLRFGKGIYSFVALSRDDIHSAKIKELVEFLKMHDYSALYCGEDGSDHQNVIYTKGRNSLLAFPYKSLHPTGFIYKTDLIKSYIKNDYSAEADKIYGSYPHDIWMVQACLDGDTCSYNKVIRKRVSDEYYNSHKSTFHSKNDELFFSPKSVRHQFEIYVNHIRLLNIGKDTKRILECDCFKRLLYESTIRYMSYVSSPDICNHYSVDTKNLSLQDLLNIIDDINQYIITNEVDLLNNRRILILKSNAKIAVFIQYSYRRLRLYIRKKKKEIAVLIRNKKLL